MRRRNARSLYGTGVLTCAFLCGVCYGGGVLVGGLADGGGAGEGTDPDL